MGYARWVIGALGTHLALLLTSVGPHGNNPSTGAGIGIIVGSVIAAAIGVAIVVWLVMKLAARNQRQVAKREPHEKGHVGSRD